MADEQKNPIPTEEIKKSTGAIKQASAQIAVSADRTTQLAADRTLYASERTYAAWVRTGLAALASGIGAKALLKGVLPGLGIKATASLLVIFSGFCFFAAVWREFFPVVPPPVPDAKRIPAWFLFAINLCLGVVVLIALISLWM